MSNIVDAVSEQCTLHGNSQHHVGFPVRLRTRWRSLVNRGVTYRRTHVCLFTSKLCFSLCPPTSLCSHSKTVSPPVSSLPTPLSPYEAQDRAAPAGVAVVTARLGSVTTDYINMELPARETADNGQMMTVASSGTVY